jgi:hypothetical protein
MNLTISGPGFSTLRAILLKFEASLLYEYVFVKLGKGFGHIGTLFVKAFAKIYIDITLCVLEHQVY